MLNWTKAQARRKHFGSGAAIGTKKTAGGLGGAVSPPAGPGQSPGGGPGGEAPGSSVNLGILKPFFSFCIFNPIKPNKIFVRN